MTRTAELYYDFASPNAYFAALALPGIAERTGATIRYRPFLLGGLFKALGTPPAPGMANPARARYSQADLNRWAKKHSFEFAFPSRFPMNTVLPLRLSLVVDETGADHAAWAEKVFRAYWAADRDISNAETCAELLRDLEIDADAALARAAAPEIKERLKQATSEAQERGVFGAPSVFVGDELFFGKDRLDFVEDALAGR